MRFDPREAFRPAKVQSFITDADLERQVAPGQWAVVDPNPGPGGLPSRGAGIWRLNQDSCTPSAPVGGLSCYAAGFEEGGGGLAVYGRVAHQDDRLVLQYWYFYYDDVYSYDYPPDDFIWQAHEGDWEVVNVVLSDGGTPLSAGYSQHCLGQRRAWADTPRLHGTHPIVHVALGSHANYFSAGTHPINVSCIPAQAVALLTQNHLPLPVDYAFDGPLAGPPRSGGRVITIHRIRRNHPKWVRFPGFWGEQEYLHAAPIGTFPFGTSPTGPAYHAVWTDPLGTLASWPAG